MHSDSQRFGKLPGGAYHVFGIAAVKYWFISYQFETHQLLMPHTWLLEAYEKLKQTNEGK